MERNSLVALQSKFSFLGQLHNGIVLYNLSPVSTVDSSVFQLRPSVSPYVYQCTSASSCTVRVHATSGIYFTDLSLLLFCFWHITSSHVPSPHNSNGMQSSSFLALQQFQYLFCQCSNWTKHLTISEDYYIQRKLSYPVLGYCYSPLRPRLLSQENVYICQTEEEPWVNDCAQCPTIWFYNHMLCRPMCTGC